ncbi:MAG: hypothetical protein MJ252_19725, partial [archaeon]|nr:hypothetical protein [archaeon]
TYYYLPDYTYNLMNKNPILMENVMKTDSRHNKIANYIQCISTNDNTDKNIKEIKDLSSEKVKEAENKFFSEGCDTIGSLYEYKNNYWDKEAQLN